MTSLLTLDGSGTYSTGDVIDSEINVVFEVVSEFSAIAISVETILGLLSLFNHPLADERTVNENEKK
jgi:hypothetical protein